MLRNSIFRAFYSSFEYKSNENVGFELQQKGVGYATSKNKYMKFLLGKKEGMTQIFDEEGNARPVTFVSVSPSVVTQVKNTEKDGYRAVQVGTGKQREKKLNKATLGHLKGKENFRFLREFRAKKGKNKEINLNEGDKIDVNIFKEGEKISVSPSVFIINCLFL